MQSYKQFSQERNCQKPEKTLETYENNPITSRVINKEYYSQR